MFEIFLFIIHASLAGGFGLFSLFVIPLFIYDRVKKRPFTKDDFTYKDILLTSICTLIFTGSFIFFMYSYDITPWVVNEEPDAVERIVSLTDSNMVNGKIYLRKGYFSEDLYYQYMVKLNGGGFKANKVKASGTILYYADSNYRVEWYTMRKQYWYLSEEKTYWKIYIPEGSITDTYSVDLE